MHPTLTFLFVSLLVPTIRLSGSVDFQSRIQPIFSEHCLECHGTDTAKGGLSLNSLKSATKTLKSGARAIVPGRPEESEILNRMTTGHTDDLMPPLKKTKRPTRDDISALRQWIAEGSEWSAHWAYRPVSVPKTTSSLLPAQIDELVLARLNKERVSPSATADRVTLLKRVFYDLTGLLPSVEDRTLFLNDPSPDAFEKLVDRTLASPHFGERWGRHWLDQARYADSDGYEKDSPRPDAWRYRDWVIDAINRDVPLDRFTVEQLAGDLLPAATPEQLLATAFHRQTLTNREGGVDQEQFRVEAVFDRTETTGTVWMAHTVQCARCHSHKYDQLSQREYYQLFSFFNDADEATTRVAPSKAEMDAYAAKHEGHRRTLENLRENYRKIRIPLSEKILSWETETRQRLNTLEGETTTPASLTVLSAKSGSKAVLKTLPDGSIQASGELSATDTYTIETEIPRGVVSGIRLTVLPDDLLPHKGPGRSTNGNFVLTEISFSGAEGKLITHSPKASFEQPGFPAAGVLDQNPESGWAIKGGQGKPQTLSVYFARPIPSNAVRELTIRLEQLSAKAKEHLLGKFKIEALVGESQESIAPEELRRLISIGSEKWTTEQRESVVDWLALFDPAANAARIALEKAEKSGPQEPSMDVRILRQRAAVRQTRIFHRGEFLSPGDAVDPNTPSILPPLRAGDSKRPTRLDLARWIVSPENPLTSRVLANQIWMRLFGEGIVRTVADFGVRGESPTHPELLDLLANTLASNGWSRKKLIRGILLSETYRRSSSTRADLSEKDPLNTLLARQNRTRVEGEIVRDLHLAAAGLLSPKIGGPSVFPPMPPDVAALSYANNFKWNESQGDDRYRRGMYTFFKRTAPYPDLMTFDCPDANTTSVRRSVSNTPLQALTTLNASTFAEAARALGKKIAALEVEGDPARIQALFETVLIRTPNRTEIEKLSQLLADARAVFRHDPASASKLGGDPEAAAWTTVARTLLNTDELITRD